MDHKKEPNNTLFFLKEPRKPIRLKNGTITKHILKLFREKKFEELLRDRNNYQLSRERVEAYLKQEGGYHIVGWSICIAPDLEPIKFLIKHVGKALLEQTLLSDSKRNPIVRYLATEKGCELLGSISENEQNKRIDRFRMLIEISPSAVDKVMESDEAKKWITEKIQQAYETALKSKEVKQDLKPEAPNLKA